MRTMIKAAVAGLMATGFAGMAQAAEIKVLAAGATKAVTVQLAERFQKETGHTFVIASDTAGGIAKRVQGGENADVVIASQGVVDTLIREGRLQAGSRRNLATTAIGVAVKEGAPKPDLSTLAAFRALLHSANTVAYVDPASGGTSGIYIAGVIDKLGMTEEMKPKLRLQAGGYVAERVARGEAEIAIHQISELLPVKGITIAGEIPPEIQSVTTYAAGLGPSASDAAKAFMVYATGPQAAAILTAAGMKTP